MKHIRGRSPTTWVSQRCYIYYEDDGGILLCTLICFGMAAAVCTTTTQCSLWSSLDYVVNSGVPGKICSSSTKKTPTGAPEEVDSQRTGIQFKSYPTVWSPCPIFSERHDADNPLFFNGHLQSTTNRPCVALADTLYLEALGLFYPAASRP